MESSVSHISHSLDSRWHPFAVVFAGACLLISLARTGSLAELLILLGIIVSGFLLARLNIREIFRMFRVFIWMLPVTFLVHLLLTSEGIRFITLIFEGNFQPELINNALMFTTKIFGFMFLMGGVLQFLKVDRLVDALTQLASRFPGNKRVLNGVIQMFNIGLRFFPLLQQEARSLQEARTGLGVGKEDTLRKRIRNQINSVVPLFIGTIHRGEVLTQTMHLRGFRSEKIRTTFIPVRWNKQDGLMVIGALGLSIALVVL